MPTFLVFSIIFSTIALSFAEFTPGGKTTKEEVLTNQPVVFVHGVSNRAGDKMKQAADFFSQHGYTFAELYGTTYANGDQGNPLQWAQYSMQCSYVKTVRALIVAVRLYTGRAVDVIEKPFWEVKKAYLRHVFNSRSIGRCVDTGENLGAPLTKFIDTFVGVAGPNHGIALQLGAISIPGCVFSILPVCNQMTGLYSGVCPAESMYLQDINRMIGYEGQQRFTIYSKTDQLVGYMVCGLVTSQVAGQNGEKIYTDKNHDNTWLESFPIQMSMVKDHIVI